jgi:hypothetical protein
MTSEKATKVAPTYSLGPRNYTIRPLAQQAEVLRRAFPMLGLTQVNRDSVQSSNIPRLGGRGIDGWFVLPNPLAVADTYGKAAELVLSMLAVQREVHVWPQVGPKSCWKSATKTESAMACLCRDQRSDLVVLPAQSGYRFQHYTAWELERDMGPNEFPLGVFAVGCMLLTHPDRLSTPKSLWIDCPADRLRGVGSASWLQLPMFSLTHSGLHFCVTPEDESGPRSGMATGFVP